ncbi:cation transporter [Trypanosoma rangeli]|uniref:Cation transporter n=1 Tax=Trypanosoma rangeli TaxID=5698 RepID=A0A3R7MPI1_TRYRA|nr:cation transporter [Trypanosoma rangeli]RNF09182.1 cation transporter [Trypanosoma rangeli]|eukprot:RNF09182.1 cation transporter [Trypanosoma rangeli]
MRQWLTSFLASLGVKPVICHAVGACGGHSHSHSHSHHHQSLESAVKGHHLRQCQLVTVVGGTTNVFLSLIKVWVGAQGGSVALVADGFHAIVDLISDVISYVTVTLSVKHLPRCRFPFGIGRIETVGAVVTAFILLVGGLMLLLQSLGECQRELSHRVFGDNNTTFPDLLHHGHSHLNDAGTQSTASGLQGHHGHSHFQVTYVDGEGRVAILWTMVFVSVASIALKEFLFRWTKRVGERAGSRVVVANAFHHRADAWSGAIVLVGVGGHCVGMPGVDGLAGLCVSYSICRVGYDLLRDSILEFFDFQCADDVASVRRVLKQYKKTPLVNVFLIRHGHSSVLHVTILVGAETTTASVVEATSELTVLARHSVAVRDTYTTLFVYDKDSEASLHEALKLLEEFHGLEPIMCRWELKQLVIRPTLYKECMDDIGTVASLFGLEVIVSQDDSQLAKRDGT